MHSGSGSFLVPRSESSDDDTGSSHEGDPLSAEEPYEVMDLDAEDLGTEVLARASDAGSGVGNFSSDDSDDSDGSTGDHQSSVSDEDVRFNPAFLRLLLAVMRRQGHTTRLLQEAEGKKLTGIVQEEDTNRRKMFLNAAALSTAQPGLWDLHPGLRIAMRSARCVACCSACGAPLFRPSDARMDVLVDRKTRPRVSLEDSEETLCVASPAVVGLVSGHRQVDDPLHQWSHTLEYLACPCCRLFIGVRVLNVHPNSNAASPESSLPTFLSTVYRSRRFAFVEMEDGLEDPCSLRACFIGLRYLRLVGPSQQRRPVHCAGSGGICSSVLTYTDQILCTRRTWSIQNSAPEQACYVNSLLPGSYRVQNEQERNLAQGKFAMADVFCSVCEKQVGYTFIRDLSEGLQNLNQVGRFGLVVAAIHVSPSDRASSDP
eukprot:NODE_1490_length_1513_cov_17.487022_g1346_i0.p1 GENE.NODE_1490_length_1513_cov_17.487022_g1346_i0~~NODE_1490_length_1513_cov_17.487022_g1346_i0.p1  ORF type:complete len:459 (-),score=78.76 NODE_1490_length_1513_cov_17.487022_g1346_i0:137-1426(-)